MRAAPRLDLRLAVPAAVAWAVLAVAIGFPDTVLPIALCAWTCAALTMLLLWTRARRRIMHPWIAVVALACCVSAVLVSSAAIRAPGRAPTELLEAARSSRFIVATAVTGQTVFAGTASFTVTIIGIDLGTRHLDVSIPARAFGEPATEELGIGSTVALRGTMRATSPGDGTAYLLFTSAAPERMGSPPVFLDWANGLRDGFRAAAARLPGDGGALLPGLAIGDTSAVSTELDTAMKASSLSHLTAVSGANCAVVVAIVIFVAARLRMRRVWRIASALAVLGGFVVLVTPEPSVLRAAVMAVIVLLTSLLGRGAQGLPILAVAVIVLLVHDPWLARDYGFTLSVLATAGLLVLSRPLTEALSRVLPVPLAAALAIPLAAQLACQPVLILLAPPIPLFGIVANILAEPAAPLGTVLGLIACMVLPVAPSLGMLIAQIAWLPATWIAATATFFASLPGAQFDWISGLPGVCAVIVASVLGLLAVFGQGRMRRVAVSVLGVTIVCSIAVVVGTTVRTGLSRPADWEFGMCDVGQGDSSVVRSGTHIAVIDTGPDPQLMSQCLDTLGIDRVEMVVLTHFDLDHVGGASALIGRADHVLVGPEDRPEALRLVSRLRDGGAVISQVHAGVEGTLGLLEWRVLWPPPPATASAIELGNDSSVTLAIDGGPGCPECLSGLFLGDLGEEPQNRVLRSADVPQVDVIKVAHHGSNNQSAQMYERARASVGLIGVGAENSYGHPTAKLLAILAATGTTAFRTDRQGLILLQPEAGRQITVWTEKGG